MGGSASSRKTSDLTTDFVTKSQHAFLNWLTARHTSVRHLESHTQQISHSQTACPHEWSLGGHYHIAVASSSYEK